MSPPTVMQSAPMSMLLSVTAALLVVVAVAHLCGRLAPRLGQPAVVGEMVAGVLLGPSLLGLVAPSLSRTLFPADVMPVLYTLGMLGLAFYMFLVGVEHRDHEHRSRTPALPVALGVTGVVLPLAAGAGVGVVLAPAHRPDGVQPWVFAAFVGGALTVTAFPMLARVLQERRMLRTEFGTVAVRAAAIDDALAWCLLAVVAAVAVQGSAVAALRTVVPAALFAVAAFWLLPRLFRGAMERAVRQGRVEEPLFVALVVLVLAASLFTDWIGIYSVFGGFVSGLALPRVEGFSRLLSVRLRQVVTCLLLPVFFVYSGLRTDLSGTLSTGTLGVLALCLAAAVVSKAVASLLVLRAVGWEWGPATAMGAMMNARGLMILVFINVGLSLGVIGTELFSVLVLVAIVTTACAVPVYRVHFTPEREEAARAGSEPSAARTSTRSRAAASSAAASPGTRAPPET